MMGFLCLIRLSDHISGNAGGLGHGPCGPLFSCVYMLSQSMKKKMPENPAPQRNITTAERPSIPTLDTVDAVVREGLDLLQSTHFGVGSIDKKRMRLGSHARFLVWQDEAVKFLKQYGLRDAAEEMAESGDVPNLIRLVEPVWSSREQRALDKLIRKTVSRKLKILRRVRPEIERKEIVSTGFC